MRQNHRAREKPFVDYAGQTVPFIDCSTGKIREAQIVVAMLGASNYTFAQATWNQALPDWIGSHVRALRFLGGVPELVVPANMPETHRQTGEWSPERLAKWAAKMLTWLGFASNPVSKTRNRKQKL